jgi:hypothetical protein
MNNELFQMTVLRDNHNLQLLRKSKNGYNYYLVRMSLLELKDPDYKHTSSTHGKLVKQTDEITAFIFETSRELEFVSITEAIKHKSFFLNEDNDAVLNGNILGKIVRDITHPYIFKGHLCHHIRFFVFAEENETLVKESVVRCFVSSRIAHKTK